MAAQHHAPVVFFLDDICGPRASFESWVNTVEVNHLTARDDGSFHFVDFETGYVHVDYVVPAIPEVHRADRDLYREFDPGGTYIETSTTASATITI